MPAFEKRCIALWLAILASCIGTNLSCSLRPRHDPSSPSLNSSPVFTPAHPTLLSTLRDYFDIEPAPPQQPIAFPHKIHLAHGMQCTDCHAGVDKGPDAALPSVKLCMACHQVIDTNNPEIKKVAAYYSKGEDIPWQRVYWFYPSAHVWFWHAPHIKAGISCTTCHGDMRQQTVAVRKVNLTMGFCLNCHRMKKAPVDCTTCHF
jgi:hypothetical protein